MATRCAYKKQTLATELFLRVARWKNKKLKKWVELLNDSIFGLALIEYHSNVGPNEIPPRFTEVHRGSPRFVIFIISFNTFSILTIFDKI